MSRTSNTRTLVRELANKIHAEGGVPTPTLIKGLLGKGSPNTIVSELQVWRKELPSNNESNKPPIPVNLLEITTIVKSVIVLVSELKESLSQAEASRVVYSQELATITELTVNVSELSVSLKTDRDWMQAELQKINARFEAVQKRMLMSIDDAREDARKWKERAISQKEESETWRLTLEQKANSQSQEIARLRALVEVYEQTLKKRDFQR